MYIPPGQGQTTPWGQNFYKNINLLSLVICCKFLPLTDFLKIFPMLSIRDQIWPCCKIGQGQPRVIIWTNYDGPKAPMLHTKPQGHWLFGSGEDFWRVFTIYGRGGHHGHVTQTWLMAAILVMWPRHREQTFIPPSHWGSTWNLASTGPAVLERKIFENGGQTDNGRMMEHAYTISSPMSLKTQVS